MSAAHPPSPRRAADAIVVGGGLIGCAVARALASEGLSVALFERGPDLVRRASAAAAGMLAPQMEESKGLLTGTGDENARTAMRALCLASRAAFPGFVRALEEEGLRRIPYGDAGTLVVALDDDDEERLARQWARQSAEGLAVELLDAGSARDLEPGLAGGVRAALFLPDDHWVDNVALGAAVAAAVRARPEEIVVETGAGVEAVVVEEGRAAGVMVGGRTVAAPRVVVAAGAWSGRLGGLPGPLPVRPVKGQMGALAPPAEPLRHVVAGPGAYAVPREDGRVLVGATMEEAGFDAVADPAAVAGLARRAAAFLASLRDLRLEDAWADLRPGTPDGLPVIGEDPELTGLIYATGHYRNGILLAPVTAAIVAAIAGGGAPPVDPVPFGPERLRSRPGGKEEPRGRETEPRPGSAGDQYDIEP